MWPMLLTLTRDECRLSLRRLELEAYSNMISVLRAQGALEENRKKLLEELRAVLHISNDRHSAEARRVANDELLATIAEHIAGPNTGLEWIKEGRRRIPLMPRGVTQSAYTEIADKVAEAAEAENRAIKKRLEAEKLLAPKIDEYEMQHEGVSSMHANNNIDESLYPPVAKEDETLKLWETELIPRKRKIPPENNVILEDGTPVKNMRNIPVNPNQRHLNLSQMYSKYSQPSMGKQVQSKHSYNQLNKLSASKANQSHTPRSTLHKSRTHKRDNKQPSQIVLSKSQMKKHEYNISPSKQASQIEYSGPAGSFQASYAQSVLGSKNRPDYMEEKKTKVLSTGLVTDSSTMQLLTQPATVPHELCVQDNTHTDDPTSLQAQSSPSSKVVSGKASHLVIKKRCDIDKKVQNISDLKVLQKTSEAVKVSSNRPLIVGQKTLNTPTKLVTTKILSSVPKTVSNASIVSSEKMIVVSRPSSSEHKTMTSSKVVITSGASSVNKELNSITKTTETLTPKGIPATDLKVSAKTVVLNPKSGQKMVVVPAKARTSTGENQMPFINLKGLPATMKLVPVTSQPMLQLSSKPSAITVVSKSSAISTTKISGVEQIKTANMADIVPVKGLTPVTATKITNPIVRPANTKGGVIVVQKGSTLGKALTLNKNNSDMSKIIMGKNVNQLLQASKPMDGEGSKCAGNVIVLELNDQTGRATTMSEIIDNNRNAARVAEENKQNMPQKITEDTPVLFESQITEETCNPNSLDSAAESIGDIVPMEESNLPIVEKDEGRKSNLSKTSDGAKDSSSVTDWEIDLDTVSVKEKQTQDKLNSIHLELGISSDSENDFIGRTKSKSKHSSQESIDRTTPSGEGSEIFSGSSGMSHATRMLLGQLQDEGSSSNDSSYAMKSKILEKMKENEPNLDKSECEALTKAQEKLAKKIAEERSQQKRIDTFSTAITTTDINLDSFSYLDEGMMAGDDEFAAAEKREPKSVVAAIDDQLSRLLAEDSTASSESQTVSENLPKP